MAQINIRPSEISDVLLQQLEAIDLSVQYEEVGKVLQVSDGVARIYGLSGAEAGELLEFAGGVMGVVMNLEQDNVGAVLLGPTDLGGSLRSRWGRPWSAAWSIRWATRWTDSAASREN